MKYKYGDVVKIKSYNPYCNAEYGMVMQAIGGEETFGVDLIMIEGALPKDYWAGCFFDKDKVSLGHFLLAYGQHEIEKVDMPSESPYN
jgi:hypothetical protein